MTPDSDDLRSMREAFAELSNEVLLDQLANQADEFRPEALALMEEELGRRGVSRRDIEAARVHHPGSEEEPEGGDLVEVATFEERLFALQAQDVLAQQGVDALLVDRRSIGPQEFPTPDVEGLHALMVPEAELARARLLLEGFTPAVEED